MINLMKNMHDYCKYGKKVYESANGNVIRKKINYPTLLNNNNREVCTTKTILTPDRKIDKTIVRCAQLEKDSFSAFTTTTPYDKITSKPAQKGKFTKEYFVKPEEKKIIDNSKPGYDYKITPLPDGTKKYEIAFPEVTLIKDGKVTTTQKNHEVIY